MAKHHRTAAASYQTLTIDETVFTLRPLTLGTYAEMESFIIERRGDPLREAAASIECGEIPQKHHSAIWDAAMRQAMAGRNVSAHEVADFENSVTGVAWKLWKCVQADHPEIDSVEKALLLIDSAGEHRFEEILRAVQLGTGEAELGN
jgi:hypothetical protein